MKMLCFYSVSLVYLFISLIHFLLYISLSQFFNHNIDLKPTNIGFKKSLIEGEEDILQLYDFGLCRELPKPQGQTHHDDELEDEETFHMSGVGTQRYMAPEVCVYEGQCCL